MAEELVEKAKVDHIDLSLEDAKAFLEESSKSGELSDDELSQVVGGGMTEEVNNIIETWMREHNSDQSISRLKALEELNKRIS